MTVTIIDRVQPSSWVEKTWLRFLLGAHAGVTVADPDGAFLAPHSVIVSQRPDLFTEAQLESIRRTPNVGLFHISDEWYRLRLDSYGAFAFVWRQHAHSGLHLAHVRALPLGPAAVDRIDVDLPALSSTPLVDRSHPVSFIGNLVTTRFAAVRALSRVPNAFVRPSGRFDTKGNQLAGSDYLDILRDSAFVACPMGNAHLESFRVYEALEAGAVPIVETRVQLDYFSLLLGKHPLPTVRRWQEAPALIRRLTDSPGLPTLEADVRAWWRSYKLELRKLVELDLSTDERELRSVEPARARRLTELLKHQNVTSFNRRTHITGVRFARKLRRTRAS